MEWMEYTRFNPDDKSASIGLSEGDLKCSAGFSAEQAHQARTIASNSTGKWYFETILNGLGAASKGPAIGLATSAATLGSTTVCIPGGEATSYGIRAYNNGAGWILFEHGYSNTWESVVDIASPYWATAMVAWDADAGKLWFGVNNTWHDSGNPAAGTNPTYTGVTGTFFVSGGNLRGGGDLTANFGATAFTYTVPTGFTSGFYSPASFVPGITMIL